MSDNLVKRLRDLGDHASFEPHMHHTAADRIEELEAACWRMKEERDRAIGWRDSDKDRADAAEAKLEKALIALGDVQRFVKDLEPYADQGHTLVPALQKACAVYTELKGETND